MIKTQPVTVTDLFTKDPPLTNTYPFPDSESLDTPIVPTFTELLEKYNVSISESEAPWNQLIEDELADPFAIYQTNLAQARPRPVRWLWQGRLPLAGITLLDGDHGCGKTLLALQLAAHVSSGTPMSDGTPTIPSGVIIITPDTDATTTQLQLLTSLGADLSRIEILSYVQETDENAPTSRYRPFSLPEDMDRLLEAVKRVKARLVILDPFMNLLSCQNRWTDQRLYRLLSNLNQHLIEYNVACLITRNCHAKGGHARPSSLERSERFSHIAVSRLLLAPDPMLPDHLLLCHDRNRHADLTPTLAIQIQPITAETTCPHMTVQGSHSLIARDLLEYRPDTLRRLLLSQQLLHIIGSVTDPIPVATLYAQFPHSSPFQIQRALSDLLRTSQIERPERGFYAKAATNPTFPLEKTVATTPNTSPRNNLERSATIPSSTSPVNNLERGAATTPNMLPANNLSKSVAILSNTSPVNNLERGAATTPNTPLTDNFARSAATPSNTQPTKKLNRPAATSKPKPQPLHKGQPKHKNTKKRR
jgi:AAA domain